jgi:hypothetical protein
VTHSATVQNYSGWAQATERDIREALALCWTPASTYTDPITPTATGPEELAAVILDFRPAHSSCRPASWTCTMRSAVSRGS